MRTLYTSIPVCVLLCACLHGQNVVTDWAAIVQPAVNTPPKPPVIQHVMRATIQIAVYDAVVSIEGGYTPYANVVPALPGADVRAAVATAAYHAARGLVTPVQAAALGTQYETYMTGIPAGDAKTNGMLAGQNAAAAIQGIRAGDGLNNVVLYECTGATTQVGEFDPDAGCGTQPGAANAPKIKPFTFTDPTRFRPSGPDPLTSIAYAADFIETRDYGRLDSTVRTAEQTDIAYFWQVFDLHQGFINLAINRGMNVRDTARFFAMVYTAAADANIAGFDAKYYYRYWRPRTAIPRADADGNPDTDPDATWKPLFSVNHPEYPSAHSFSSGAIMDAIARFFGTSKVTWTLIASRAAAPQLVKTERTYTDLNAVMREIDDARVWAGLHWRHSMYHGADIGRRVAKHVCDNFFLPVR